MEPMFKNNEIRAFLFMGLGIFGYTIFLLYILAMHKKGIYIVENPRSFNNSILFTFLFIGFFILPIYNKFEIKDESKISKIRYVFQESVMSIISLIIGMFFPAILFALFI